MTDSDKKRRERDRDRDIVAEWQTEIGTDKEREIWAKDLPQ